MRNINSRLMKIGYVGAGLVAGAVLAATLGAQAAITPTPTTTGSSSSTAADPHPGDNGADGVAESKEVHGGGGRGGTLDLSGTVASKGSNTVTIKTSAGTTVYSVTSSSDIDKNGEAALSSVAVGDGVTFSVDSSNVKLIDKLHAGNEAKDMPQGGAPSGSASSNGA